MPLLRDEPEFGPAAQAMIDTQLAARDIRDPRVLDAMRTVPRHVFVSDWHRSRAYDDAALPTLNGQTISQPYVVAVMSQMLGVEPGDRVLEIGTGSGYQTMILSRLAGSDGSVISVERDQHLAAQARHTLADFAVANVAVHVGDGTLGWPPDAPYDRILVTAGAPPEEPPALIEQLAEGGRLVIPLGDREVQYLYRIDKSNARLTRTRSLGCRFVPLIGEQGWRG